jgi:predicted nucleic acid-binding protein
LANVIAESVLVDTGPLVAILNKRDRHHVACREQAKEFTGTISCCWAVLTEAAWLLRDQADGLSSLLRMVSLGDLTLLDLDPAAAAWMDQCAKTYEGLRPQLADLSLVYLAHRHDIRHIFTLDRRDFLVYRDKNGEAFRILPENA